MESDAMILIFWTLNFKQVFHSPFPSSSRDSLVPLHFLPLEWYYLHNWGFLFQLQLFQLVIQPARISHNVLFSRSVVSDSLKPHGLKQARSPHLSTPGAYSNSCTLHPWCHPNISSYIVPFSSHLQSFSASGSFPMSQFFESGGKNIGVSASTSVLPMSIQDWFPLGLTGWISLQSQGTLKSLLQHHSSKTLILHRSAFFIVQLSHPYMNTAKTVAWLHWPLLVK